MTPYRVQVKNALTDLTSYVGPPLAGSFATLLRTSDVRAIDMAIAAYRRRFEAIGIFENTLYPGVAEMLAVFKSSGYCMSVVTAKPRTYTVRILKHFAIASLFHGVHGPELGARHDTKESLILEALSMVPTRASRAFMIGDRAEDIRGARRNGVRSVAVTWGYGELSELETAEPDHVVNSTSELLE